MVAAIAAPSRTLAIFALPNTHRIKEVLPSFDDPARRFHFGKLEEKFSECIDKCSE
jgi:hypothetical protein